MAAGSLLIRMVSSCSADATMFWETVLTRLVMKENLEKGDGETREAERRLKVDPVGRKGRKSWAKPAT